MVLAFLLFCKIGPDQDNVREGAIGWATPTQHGIGSSAVVHEQKWRSL